MGRQQGRVISALLLFALTPLLALAGCAVIEIPITEPRPSPGLEAPDLPDLARAPTSVEAEIEVAILELTNQERARGGIAELERHEGLDEVARRWSQHMAAGGLDLAHNPDFADQIPRGWVTAGENVAWIQDRGRLEPEEIAERIHQGWMESEGHRENLLQPAYTHLGVGVAHDPDYGYYLTQNFAEY
jgi:uncharacterized protein YkwD